MLINWTAFWWKVYYVGSGCVKQNCPRQRPEPRRHINNIFCALAEGHKLPNPCSHFITSAFSARVRCASETSWETGLPSWRGAAYSEDWTVCTCTTPPKAKLRGFGLACSPFSSPHFPRITVWRVGFSPGRHNAFVVYQDWPLLHRLQTKLNFTSKQLRFEGKKFRAKSELCNSRP